MKKCTQCGKCCINYSDGGLSASTKEIENWEIFRPEIYRYVHDGKIWVDPVLGKPLKNCPWLRKSPQQNKYTCDIYDDRPEDCRFYPVTIGQMVRDKCEMLESPDLNKPELAQKKLNRLMADSRPPFK